jgi:hypothetical protein
VDEQGTPWSASSFAASTVRADEYDEIPAYSAFPCSTAVMSEPIVSSSGVSVGTVGVEDVDVVEAHAAATGRGGEQVLA